MEGGIEGKKGDGGKERREREGRRWREGREGEEGERGHLALIVVGGEEYQVLVMRVLGDLVALL